MKLLFASALALALGVPLAAANAPPPMPAAEDIPEPNGRGTAAEFVTSIYASKLAAEGIRADLGRNTTSHIILYSFTPELLGLYKQAMDIEEVVIGADMFMMAQDWDTKSATAKVLDESATGATVQADFKNFGEDRAVVYTLKKSKAGTWQIDNIVDPKEGADVRKMIAEGLAAQP